MAGAREIQVRMKSIQDTMKITNAMYMISSAKLKKARKNLENEGFFMRSSGVSTYYGNTTKAEAQSVSAGESAPIGTVIDVQFSNVVEDGWVDSGVD